MSRDVRGKMFLNAGFRRHLIKIGVHALVGDNGYHHILCHGLWMVMIFCRNLPRNVEKWDRTDLARFLTALSYPHLPLVIGDYLITGEG